MPLVCLVCVTLLTADAKLSLQQTQTIHTVQVNSKVGAQANCMHLSAEREREG